MHHEKVPRRHAGGIKWEVWNLFLSIEINLSDLGKQRALLKSRFHASCVTMEISPQIIFLREL